MMVLPTELPEALIDSLIQDIRVKGWSVQEHIFPNELVEALCHEAENIDSQEMRQAGIGRDNDHQVILKARRDRIQWIDRTSLARACFLDCLEHFRIVLNRRLLLGLFDYEAHFARYQQGDFYEKHLDAFKGKSNRVLSTVLYLNKDWRDDQGGELIMFDELEPEREILRVTPKAGRLVTFLSESFYHEVKPAQSERHSIAGWFRINNSTGQYVDPGR